MNYNIQGSDLQVLNIQLQQGEQIKAGQGTMVYKSSNVTFDVNSFNIISMIKRMLTKESLFLPTYTCENGVGIVGFSSGKVGKLVAFELNGQNQVIGEANAYLCSDTGVEIDVHRTSFKSAAFGGEGLFLQKYTGVGTVILGVYGDIIEYNLEVGQEIHVDTSKLVAFDSTVSYEIVRAGSVKNSFLGGKGFFLNKMVGPGRVVIQSISTPVVKKVRNRK